VVLAEVDLSFREVVLSCSEEESVRLLEIPIDSQPITKEHTKSIVRLAIALPTSHQLRY
jgi:hypothetical protein